MVAVPGVSPVQDGADLVSLDKNIMIEQVIVDDVSFVGHTFSQLLECLQCGIKVSSAAR